MFLDKSRVATHLLVITIAAMIVGAASGVTSWALFEALDQATELRLDHGWLVWLLPVAAFIVGLTVILQSLDLLSESGKVLAAAGNTESDLWVYVSLRAPQIVQLFLPFSVLLATLVTLATLNQNSEVIAMKAGTAPA